MLGVGAGPGGRHCLAGDKVVPRFKVWIQR